MKKTKSILMSGLLAIGLLFALMMAIGGSVSARTDKSGTPDQPANQVLSNFDSRGTFHNLTGPTDGDPLSIALNFIQAHSQELGVTAVDVADLVVTDQYTSRHTGVTHIYLQQQYEGIGVFNGRININIAPDGSVINVGNRLTANLAQSVNSTIPALTAETAVQAAARQLDLTLTADLVVEQAIGGASQAILFSDGGISQNAIPVHLVYESTDSGAVRLAWNVEIYELSSLHWWAVRIDAVTGEMISQTDYVNSESWGEAHEEDVVLNPDDYRVFAHPLESPYDGPRTLASNPADPTASPFGWHDTNGASGAEFTITQGNNVHADTDLDANNVPDGNAPDGGGGLIFDFAFDPTQQPADYIPFAVTNLFYWNNIIHDVMYLYGFDEISGNFQENNYGNGGVGSDYVHADAQDGSGTNNANFATPPDGSNPRMQMFIWTNPFAQLVTVNAPITMTGSYTANPSINGGSGAGITADLELVDDGVAPADDGCQTIVNDLTGKIALMVWSQGICNSSVFVGNAAAAGAVAAIIIDVTPIPLTNFGGNAAIPSVAIGSDDGQLFLNAIITGGLTINVTLEDNPAGQINRDSDLDNGIIAHEYGHGISNRLTGGPGTTGCLNNAEQMGEGWSDLMTLILHADAADTPTTNRGVGTYALFDAPDGVGIRLFPYNTDMNVNPQTYDSIITNGTSPHSLGEVWAAMYWEVYWNLVNKHGFNPDIYQDWTTGGNNLALQLLMDGMKLQPCSPGMVDGRDAILAADMALTSGDNQCEIWEGFAKRGLGFSANQGSPFSRTDGTEAFDLPLACIDAMPSIVVEPASISGTQYPDSQVTHTLTISNVGLTDLTWEIVEQAPAPLNGGNWFDNFDSYATGSQMHGQGGWKGWDNSPAAGALTSDAQSFSAPNSVEIVGVSDLVHEYSGYTSGQWTYTAWQYIPDGFSGNQMFILLNTYNDGGPYNWSTQVRFDSVANQAISDFDGGALPLITGEWVELRVEIDLDADLQTFYYDGQMLYQKSWVDGVTGGGTANIAAVDLWGNSSTAVYYDNISLHPPGQNCPPANDIPWVTVSPITGTVAAGAADQVGVTMDSTGLATGVYTSTLCVASNDPVTPLVEVPLTLTVEEAPVYGVEITAVDDTLTGTAGAIVTYTVHLTNTGNMTDTFAITTTGNIWMTHLSATSVTLGAGATDEVMVVVHIPVDAANNDTDTVTVTATSDGDGSTGSVALTTTAVVEGTPETFIYLPIILKP
ncbi:MAG: M36 family metallopeptidase [Anaerolineae bacterium]|nr:M36 family metallopeptidase [Anaerolineae bacterium]